MRDAAAAHRDRIGRLYSQLADAMLPPTVPPARRIVMTGRPVADPEADTARDLTAAVTILRRSCRPNRLTFLRSIAAR